MATSQLAVGGPDGLDPELQQSVILTKIDWVKDWGRRNALWPMAFGLACCAMEMMATAATKYDLDRFGAASSAPPRARAT
jgi:NADH-quinone oxidoreductase subunit B